jgi:hypothetical protein
MKLVAGAPIIQPQHLPRTNTYHFRSQRSQLGRVNRGSILLGQVGLFRLLKEIIVSRSLSRHVASFVLPFVLYCVQITALSCSISRSISLLWLSLSLSHSDSLAQVPARALLNDCRLRLLVKLFKAVV